MKIDQNRGVQGGKGVWGGPQLHDYDRYRSLVFCKVRQITQKIIWKDKNPSAPHGWGVQGAKGVWGGPQLRGQDRYKLLVFFKVR